MPLPKRPVGAQNQYAPRKPVSIDPPDDPQEIDERPASYAQVDFLEQLGVDRQVAEAMTLEEAKDKIAELKSRPSPKQIKCLLRNRIPKSTIDRLTRDEAHQMIAEIADKNGWGGRE